ncbi:phosphonate C-P lyase system protein PhnH [Thalassovita taeanensis]|uniref:Alpha-D-ribose 1-methylphosphonate 5-triphosphate synthase subunit PhnH n=1 Tax=Thalassovita taeanensis TaxID=657014 RepID=A0A1H9BZM3_9RHOB|nr:phosphonate C-P lyase system protein PhnH [Thalassovita taeanensis]SEP94475.1 alpha-D-ribose 1-methylphosphonate 5-triphosphate synthase subunit PhnH [Thalassovita taeanensis]
MQVSALEGGFSDAPVQAARAFRAAMSAMARPGTIETVTDATPPAPLSVAAGVLALTLLDPETPVYLAGALDCPQVREWITFHTGAPIAGRSTCAFALGRWADLVPLPGYRIGTSSYPDRSATLIAEVDLLEPSGTTLSGPGIMGVSVLSLPETETIQANHAQFPLGVDFFLTCGDRLAGLPRSTKVEAL